MGLDTLKMQQLSSLLTQMGEGAATYNPVQQSQLRGLTASAQSSISAEAEKKAKKEAEKKKNKGIGKAVGTVGAIAAAPFTGGASLAYLPMAAQAGDGLESVARGNVMGGMTDIGMAAAGGYGAYTDPSGMGHLKENRGFESNETWIKPPDKNPGMMLGESVKKAPASAQPASAPMVTQGTPVPQAPPVQVKALPKPAVSTAPAAVAPAPGPPPAMAPAAGSATMPSDPFNVSAAALAGLTALTMARADDRKTPMNLTQGAQVRPGGLRGNSMPQIPTDGKPITLEEAKRRGFDQQQIAVLRKQGLISGTDPKDIAVAGLAAAGAGLLAGGSKNA